MKRILTAVVLIPVVLLIVVWAPLWLFAAAVALVAVLAMREYLDIAKGYGGTPFRKAALIAAVGICALSSALDALRPVYDGSGDQYVLWLVFSEIGHVLIGILLAFPLCLLLLALRRADKKQAMPDVALTTLGYFYVAIPLALLVFVRHFSDGAFLVICLFVVVWVGDAAAYYVGKNFGRHLLAPNLSPKKTWEGSIASVIGSVVAGCAMFYWHHPILGFVISRPMPSVHGYSFNHRAFFQTAILLAIVINIAAQLGDLVESMLKRGANIKDSGAILPGHGGMLDRIDALLFAIPVMWYYAAFHAEHIENFYSPR